jgi:hypothetical protein
MSVVLERKRDSKPGSKEWLRQELIEHSRKAAASGQPG